MYFWSIYSILSISQLFSQKNLEKETPSGHKPLPQPMLIQFTVAIWCLCYKQILTLNTLRPRQNGHHLQMIFSNAFSWMKMFEFRLRFHWNCFLMVVSLPIHICVTRPQWVKTPCHFAKCHRSSLMTSSDYQNQFEILVRYTQFQSQF